MMWGKDPGSFFFFAVLASFIKKIIPFPSDFLTPFSKINGHVPMAQSLDSLFHSSKCLPL